MKEIGKINGSGNNIVQHKPQIKTRYYEETNWTTNRRITRRRKKKFTKQEIISEDKQKSKQRTLQHDKTQESTTYKTKVTELYH